mgnify:CR=1 FL=1|jgi:hypothetical protein
MEAKSENYVELLVIGLVLVLGIAAWSWQKEEIVTADSALEIGITDIQILGARKAGSKFEDLEFKLGVRIQQGKEIYDEIKLKYGFESKNKPALIHRISRNQHIVYGDVFELTAVGDEVYATIDFSNQIIAWLMRRHTRIYEQRELRKRSLLSDIQRQRRELVEFCGHNDSAFSSKGDGAVLVKNPGCNFENYSRLALDELRIRYLEILAPSHPSKILLSPTVR